MKVFLLANAQVGLEVTKIIRSSGDEIVGLCIHEPELRRLGNEIVEASGIPASKVYTAKQLRDPKALESMAKLGFDMAVSAFWAYILKPPFLKLAPRGTINLHPGYLPYCRGKNPNVWPFIEGSPAGVTIHYVDEGIDTGDIIARRKVPVPAHYHAGNLYDDTLTEIVSLFEETWPKLSAGTAARIPQSELESPTFHLGKEVEKLDEIDLNRHYRADELINQLRARSYSDRSYSYFISNGKKVKVRISLEEDPSEPVLPTNSRRDLSQR